MIFALFFKIKMQFKIDVKLNINGALMANLTAKLCRAFSVVTYCKAIPCTPTGFCCFVHSQTTMFTFHLRSV